MYNRLELNGEVNKYSLPFERDVSKDPSFEEMRHVVVTKKMRPQLEQHSNESEYEQVNLFVFHYFTQYLLLIYVLADIEFTSHLDCWMLDGNPFGSIIITEH